MPNPQALNAAEATVIDRELVVKRIFNASPELIYRTWTEAEHLSNWWGPQGFTITIEAIEVAPGGVWRYIMHGPDGTDYINKITYIEIVHPEKLVYSHGDDQDPEHFRVTVTFEGQDDGKTLLTMTSLFKTAEDLAFVAKEYGAIEGAKSTLERLGQLLDSLS